MITIIDGSKEKVCPKCHVKMEPEIFSDPDINPRETGNPWKCPKCETLYGCNGAGELTYYDHVLLVRDRVVNNINKGDKNLQKSNL